MKMSVREARAQFATALDAVEKGERVTITKNGKAVAELGPPIAKKGGIDWDKLHKASKKSGLDKYKDEDLWPPEFDEPAVSRAALGLDDNWEPYRR